MVENLRLLRTKKGISQKALGDAIGISQQTINKYENHAIEPDIFLLKKMADYFETTVDFLIGHTKAASADDEGETYTLKPDETVLIEKYRLLSPKERESIQMVMQNYMEK